MKRERYMKHHDNYSDAFDSMVVKNQAREAANNRRTIFCLVDGPDDMFTVMDTLTALENEFPFTYSFSFADKRRDL